MFELIYSWTTSPIYDYIAYDSTIFMLLGRFTKAGLIPYVDFFYHKGPVLVFIEWLGCIMGEDYGIFLLQIIFMIATIAGMYKIIKTWFKKQWILVAIIISMLILTNCYQCGNLTEEYCLPFLMWSMLLGISFLRGESEEHKGRYAFFYGITFAICAFTRITNALPLCTLVLVILIILFQKKKVANLIKNAVCFLLGAAVITVPVIIYFAINRALYDMVYATFIHNILYASEEGTSILTTAVELDAVLVPLVVSLFVGFVDVFFLKEERKISIVILITAFIGMVFQLESRPYAHYFMIYVPIYVLTLGVLTKHLIHEGIYKKILVAILVASCGVIGAKNVLQVKVCYNIYTNDYIANFREESIKIAENIPSEDYDKVIAYNVEASFYYNTGIIPCYKNFILQDMQCSVSEELREGFKDDIESLEAEYIVLGNENEPELIDFIEENYVEVYRTDSLHLMKLKNS